MWDDDLLNTFLFKNLHQIIKKYIFYMLVKDDAL